MNLAKHTFFLFGDSFLKRLSPVLQENGSVVGQITGISPLSNLCICPQLSQDEISEWLPLLDAMLAQCNAEYLVLDLQAALRGLFVLGEQRICACADVLSHLKRQEIAAVNPTLLRKGQIKSAIKALLKVLTGHFPTNRIILLHTSFPDYWLAGTSLRVLEKPFVSKAQVSFLSKLEAIFRREAEGCHYIDITRFYFYQKTPGYLLTDAVFEKECYIDVAKQVFAIANGESPRQDRPDFALSLDRYASYFFTLQRKPQRIFLNANYFLDRLILCADAKFVSKNREELIELDRYNWHSPKKALSAMKASDPQALLTKVCMAFYAAQQGHYTADVDYALMFRCEVVPDNLLSHLKNSYAPTVNLLPSQISRHNAGYHFAKMLGIDPEPFCTDSTVAEPTTVDIFGSCISRTLFNVQDNDFAVNRYWFHVAPFQMRNQKVNYNPLLFAGKVSWTDRLVRLQFENNVFDDIESSPAHWLMIDLYFLISPYNYYYQNCLYSDFDQRISNKLEAKKVNLFKDSDLFGTHDDLIHAMDPWIELIKKKYGNRIILVTCQRQDHWLGDDERIYELKKKSSVCNPLLNKAEQYLLEKLDCYCIDIGKFFLPDEQGFMRNTPAHKEDLCYFTSHELVRYIVDHEPAQRRFDRCPGSVQLAHLHRLAAKNSPSVLEKALPLSELDRAVIRLSEDERSALAAKLTALYDACDPIAPLEQILNNPVCDAAVSSALQQAMSKAAAVCPNQYPRHREDNRLSPNPFAICSIPAIAAIKVKEARYQKSQVFLSWQSPCDCTVHIYRADGNAPWKLIHKTNLSEFTDTTVPTDVNYQYVLCIETPFKDKSILLVYANPLNVRQSIPKRVCYKVKSILQHIFRILRLSKAKPSAPLMREAFCLNGVNTLRWTAVYGADTYQIYRKNSLDEEWKLCATVAAEEETFYKEAAGASDGGQWYAVRAQKEQKYSDLSSGICALPL